MDLNKHVECGEESSKFDLSLPSAETIHHQARGLFNSATEVRKPFAEAENQGTSAELPMGAITSIASTYFPLTTRGNDRLEQSSKGNISPTRNKLQDERQRKKSSEQNVCSGSEFSRTDNEKEKPYVQNHVYPYPVNPFAIPGIMNNFGNPNSFYGPPFTYPPETLKWMQNFAANNRSFKANNSDLDHNYEFRTNIAKTADDKAKKYFQDLGRTIRTVVKIAGSFEAAFITIRACFYGILHAVEYGSHGWQTLCALPVIRVFFWIVKQFWRYVKFVGRNGPLVGFFALICTYLGRAIVPMIRNALGSSRPCNNLRNLRIVTVEYRSQNFDEMDITAGEKLLLEGVTVMKNNRKFVMVRRVEVVNGKKSRGLIPEDSLQNSKEVSADSVKSTQNSLTNRSC